MSNHHLVDFKVICAPEVRCYKKVVYRNLNSIDQDTLSTEMKQRWGTIDKDATFGENVTRYTNILEDMMNQKAPERSKMIKIVPDAPWFDNEYRELRKQRRRAEKAYKKSNRPEDHETFKRLKKDCTELAYKKKKDHYTKKIEEGNSRTMYSVVNRLLDKKQEKVLPSTNDDKQLANDFVKFFTEKIEKLRAKFKNLPETNIQTL